MQRKNLLREEWGARGLVYHMLHFFSRGPASQEGE